ncbi:UPF0149 family protein [Rhizobium laguerreae]|uniref:UPF0149 family protein n=1 Tax=Rhizobium laguerreae TaxID=1076926 RepID=UPI0021B09D57|nr:UPF0149 family protein [Rhizobium laguerreae]
MTQNGQETTARQKLDDEAFEAFIRGRRPASPIWSMSGFDGYLTALIIGPKFIDPRQWIPELTGPDALNLPMETTEHQAVQTIVAEYNRIDETLILSCEFYEELISWNEVFRIVDVLTLFGICFWPAIG